MASAAAPPVGNAAAALEPPQQQSRLVPFPLLADSQRYVPFTFDYHKDCSRDPQTPVNFASWIEVFRKSIPTFKAHAATDASIPADQRQAKAEQFAVTFAAALDALLAHPQQDPPGFSGVQPVNAITLCRLREQVLRDLGYTDIFKSVKDTENTAALELLPKVLHGLDSQPTPTAALDAALRGVFAGNIFDLGAAASAERYEAGQGAGFHCALDQLLPRPWVLDDLDAILSRFSSHTYNKALLFVDNAGADVLLGMLPFARELLKRGTKVILAANAAPTINDITAAELQPLVAAAAAQPDGDALLASALASGQLRVMSSGNDMPVIDVSQVSPELAAEAADGTDLVVFEGMGRGIETNLLASLSCDSMKLAMIKHPEVAVCVPGGRLYDCVCKFDPAGADASVLRLTRADAAAAAQWN